MKNEGQPQPITERSFEFAVRVVKHCQVLDEKRGVPRVLGPQILRFLYSSEYVRQQSLLNAVMVAALTHNVASAVGVAVTAMGRFRVQLGTNHHCGANRQQVAGSTNRHRQPRP